MKHTLEDSTFETYGRRIRLHIVPHIGHLALGKLGPQGLTQLYSTLLDQDLSPSTVRYDHAILH
jgi:Phage integrase, N-terminal SAM-like domain